MGIDREFNPFRIESMNKKTILILLLLLIIFISQTGFVSIVGSIDFLFDDEIINWKNAPVIPEEISQTTIDIFIKGQENGNIANRYSRAADCNGVPSLFLGTFDYPEDTWELGDFESLRSTIQYYAGAHQHSSQATLRGFNAASLLSPFMADPEECEAGESPLVCELNAYRPSVLFIFMGTNDAYRQETFEMNMRMVIETTIEHGTIPIISSKPDDLEETNDVFNSILFALAIEYDVPFWNFWASIQDLPNHGMDVEEIGHITWAPSDFSNEFGMTAAWPHRNLEALQILELLKNSLPIE